MTIRTRAVLGLLLAPIQLVALVVLVPAMWQLYVVRAMVFNPRTNIGVGQLLGSTALLVGIWGGTLIGAPYLLGRGWVGPTDPCVLTLAVIGCGLYVWLAIRIFRSH